MKIAYNPKTAAALTTAPSNNDITFDLSGLNIFVRGERFKGTDTTYTVFKKHTSEGKGGYDGLVPVPSYIATNNRFLREDGKWAIPTSVYSQLTNQDLNTLMSEGSWYFAGGSNNVTNKPSGVDAFELYVGRNAIGYKYLKIISHTSLVWFRYHDSTKWHSWTRWFTDANTDLKVLQSLSTSSNYKPLVLGYTESSSPSNLGTATTLLVYTTTSIYAQPSTGAIWANKIYSGGKLVITEHQSLANYVTLNTTQTITGVKTFKANPILPSPNSIIQHTASTSNYATLVEWFKGGVSQNTYNPQIGHHNTGGDGNGSICILPYATTIEPWSSNIGLYISKGILRLDGRPVALAENYYTKTESDTRYVNISGDTMTGMLNWQMNGVTSSIGSLNNGYMHYSTNAANGHHFNKDIRVSGNIYGGADYNRLVSFKDEINIQVGGSKQAQMRWSSWGSDSYGGAIQIQELGYVGVNQSAWEYSPAISFHWGGRHVKRFGLRSDGQLAIDNIPISLTTHNHNTSYVTALGVQGDHITWTKNGINNILIAPYSSSSGYVRSADTRGVNDIPKSLGSGARFFFKSNSTDGLNDGGNYHGVMHFRPYGTHEDFTGGQVHQLGFTDNSRLHMRTSTGIDSWGPWKKFAYITDIKEPSNYYWANIKVSTTSATNTSPTFANAIITNKTTTPQVFSSGVLSLSGTGGLYLKYNNIDSQSIVLNNSLFKPFDAANNTLDLGSTSARWKNFYAYTGNFLGNITVGIDKFWTNSQYGLDMQNSDIIKANGIYFADVADGAGEGLNFYRNATNWDTLNAANGVLYFSPNRATATHTLLPVFSNLVNSQNNISLTIGGHTKTLTVGYASNAGTLNGLSSTAFRKAWTGYAGGKYINWVKLVEWKLSKANHFWDYPVIFNVLRDYNYNPCESYSLAITFGWGNASITLLSGCAGSRIIEKFRISKTADGLTYYLEMYVNPSYTAGSNPCSFTMTSHYGIGPGKLLCEILTANVSEIAGVYTSHNNTVSPGYIKMGSSNSFVLLGGGHHKAISDFVLKSELVTLNTTTIIKTLTVTREWMDTGIASTDFPASGTYILQLYVPGNDGTGNMWSLYNSGVMSWYKEGTNSTNSDEIILHRAGHAYANVVYLRTIGTPSGIMKLQICANTNIGKAYNYTFKFKRII